MHVRGAARPLEARLDLETGISFPRVGVRALSVRRAAMYMVFLGLAVYMGVHGSV